MREIKFRAWLEYEKEMQYATFMMSSHGVADFGRKGYGELMQYTGLKDKNGVEIYEGDLLDVDTENRIVKVVWFQPQACFDTDVVRVIDKTWPFFKALQNSEWQHRCEVIGNIYENKELL